MARVKASKASRSEGLVKLVPQWARQGWESVSRVGRMAPRMMRDCSNLRAVTQKAKLPPNSSGSGGKEDSQG